MSASGRKRDDTRHFKAGLVVINRRPSNRCGPPMRREEEKANKTRLWLAVANPNTAAGRNLLKRSGSRRRPKFVSCLLRGCFRWTRRFVVGTVSQRMPIAAKVVIHPRRSCRGGRTIRSYVKLLDDVTRMMRGGKKQLTKEVKPILERLSLTKEDVVDAIGTLRKQWAFQIPQETSS